MQGMRADKLILLVLLAVCAVAARWLVPASSAKLPECAYAEIHLRPLGGPLPNGLETSVSKFLGRSVIVDEQAPMPQVSRDAERGQYDAERCGLIAPQGQFVLEVTALDLYTSGKPEWGYCFGQRFENGGVISSARMGGVPERLQKMAIRYVLEGAYGCRRVNDPGSLLHEQILGPGDLDAMQMRL